MDEYLAIIKLFAGTFAPMGFAYCDGTVLNTNVNQALYSLLGNIYGGSASSSTFALPDLRGRAAIGVGLQTASTSNRQLGEKGGVETVTLLSTQVPSHGHDLYASTTLGTTNTPSSTMAIATPPNISQGSINKPVNMYAAPNSGTMTALLSGSVGATTGGGQSHNNLSPYLALNYLIVTSGLYPERP